MVGLRYILCFEAAFCYRVDVNYRYYDEDYFTLKGLGAGVAYKF
jgi:hypothetical protein